jgi:hypothetical protein
MRKNLIFVISLLVDTDEPQALRGSIRSVTSAEEHAFADEQSLVALLRQIGHATEASCEDHDNVEQPQTAQPGKEEMICRVTDDQ